MSIDTGAIAVTHERCVDAAIVCACIALRSSTCRMRLDSLLIRFTSCHLLRLLLHSEVSRMFHVSLETA